MSNELPNIPPIFNALSIWLCGMLFIYFLPRRKHFTPAAFSITAWGFLIAEFLLMQATTVLDGMAFNLTMLAFAVLSLVPFLILCQTNLTNCLTYCAYSFIFGSFIVSLFWQVCVYLALFSPIWTKPPVQLLIFIVFFAIFYTALYFIERQHRMQLQEMQVSLISCVGTVFMAFLIYIVSSLSFASVELPFTVSTYADAYTLRTMVYLGGVGLLYSQHALQCESFISLERDTLQSMLNLQYENFKLSQESVDMVNQKYHDLKHQISLLRSEFDSSTQLSHLDQLEQDIRIYETQNKTGNRFLDTILMTKSVHCQNAGIKLTCVANGHALDFMDVMDLSSLFGNALDNAIEAASQLEDPEQRLIRLSVSYQKGFLCIWIENRCRETLTVAKGIPFTSKKDTRYHGFGVKSIYKTAEKYGGTASVHAENGWFELRVLIPREEVDTAK
ncbi:MAG: GHKL domain-containing protein [Ruminococcus sp.]|nr:GHKL domain-containing protein [Ruminococcus sp.]